MSAVQSKTDNLLEKPQFQETYDNFIGGKWVPPSRGEYFDAISPVDGKPFTQVARSTAEDVELALDAAWDAAKTWNRTSATERSNILLKIADIMEQNLELLARVETWDNGKAIRETRAADMPLAVDHFRYFAGVIRAEEGSASELDSNTLSLIIHEPLGVVGQIIPWNFPILMATWKLAPALAAGNCVVLKPAEQTPVGIMVLMDLIKDVLPAGVINVVNGFGIEAGKPLLQVRELIKLPLPEKLPPGSSSCNTLQKILFRLR
jgi:aldehyde dehydrogenase